MEISVSNIIEKFGKAIFEAPFGTQKIAQDAPELAEIRIAVLDAVKAKSHQASGRSVFPYNLVRINLLGVPAEQAAPFHGEFLAKYFAEELRNGLARSNYRFPDDLFVEITTTPTLPAPNQEWLTVDTLITERVAPEAVTAIHSPAHLVVEAGAAKPSEITINAARINLGRTVEVYREGSGLARRNDIAFGEQDEIGRSVSREHAHILYSPQTGECRLVNDRIYRGEGNCGTYIVRDGFAIAVHRNARGTLLQSGDQIQLGQALLRFRVD
jgi:hypothetical protein